MRATRPREHLLEVPAPRLADVDLGPLLLVSAVVWITTFVLQFVLGDEPATSRRVAHALVEALAGAAFSVLVAGLFFDRIKRSAERAAQERLDAERSAVVTGTRDVWLAEYGDAYETLAREVTIEAALLARTLLRVVRTRPVRRALHQRGLSDILIDLDLQDLALLETRLEMQSVAALDEVAHELEQVAKRLGDVPPQEPDQVAALDFELLGELLTDVRESLPEVERCAGALWRAATDLRLLHRELLDSRLPDPELSIGQGLRSAAELNIAVSTWRLELGSAGSTQELQLLCAQALVKQAHSMANAARLLQQEVARLRNSLHTSTVDAIGDSGGQAFVRRLDAETDEATASLDAGLAQRARSGPQLHQEQSRSARERTFDRVDEQDMLPEGLRI